MEAAKVLDCKLSKKQFDSHSCMSPERNQNGKLGRMTTIHATEVTKTAQ